MFFEKLFGKKSTSSDNYNIIKDERNVLQSDYEWKPMIIRLNKGLNVIAGNWKYPYRIWIAIPLSNYQENWLPTPEQNIQLDKIEDEICKLFEKNHEGFLSVVIMTNGMKEFIIYSKEIKETEKNINKLNSLNSNFQLQFYVEKDSNWDFYKSFV